MMATPQGVSSATTLAIGKGPESNPYAPWIPDNEAGFVYIPPKADMAYLGTRIDMDDVDRDEVPLILCYVARKHRTEGTIDEILGALVRIFNDRGMLQPVETVLAVVAPRGSWWSRKPWRRALASLFD